MILLACILSVIIAAIAWAVIDKPLFHWSSSIFSRLDPKYWQVLFPGESWLNKYKGRKYSRGPAFPGSTTWLVWLTDSFHLFKQIVISTVCIPPTLVVCMYFDWWAWWLVLLIWFGWNVVFAVTFHYFFHTVFALKSDESQTDKPLP